MNNYQITEVQKHNLEVALLNSSIQIQHLIMLLDASGCQLQHNAAKECLKSLESNGSVLNGLKLVDTWVDLESDVQN